MDLDPEHGDVEPRVAPHEWIERPHDPLDAALAGPRLLVEFDAAAQPGLADAGEDPGDVTVQRRGTVVDGEKRDRRTEHLALAIDRGGDVPAGVGDRHQQFESDQFGRRTPDLLEYIDHTLHVLGGVEPNDLDSVLRAGARVHDRYSP